MREEAKRRCVLPSESMRVSPLKAMNKNALVIHRFDRIHGLVVSTTDLLGSSGGESGALLRALTKPARNIPSS